MRILDTPTTGHRRPGWRHGFAVFESQTHVATLAPDMARVAEIDVLGVICTASGEDCDFVSLFFSPGAGVPEDPVTGSAHCTPIPYWADRLGMREMLAPQISWRGGEIYCEHKGVRIGIGGEAMIYLGGTITP